MRTTEQITITVKIPVADTIRRLAEAEGRNVSNMCTRLIELGIKNKGASPK